MVLLVVKEMFSRFFVLVFDPNVTGIRSARNFEVKLLTPETDFNVRKCGKKEI